MTQQASPIVRAMVLREIEEGVKHDALWLQALSESKLDPAQTKLRYIALRTQAIQRDMKGLLIDQIRGAVAKDKSIR
ncbi:MAG: hypothetical protein EBS44_02880 [Betaproteobacteria bacterium]|nr:hypothetical protein [Betaproteobacteria bacterium]